jgi:hypothetical protein
MTPTNGVTRLWSPIHEVRAVAPVDMDINESRDNVSALKVDDFSSRATSIGGCDPSNLPLFDHHHSVGNGLVRQNHRSLSKRQHVFRLIRRAEAFA